MGFFQTTERRKLMHKDIVVLTGDYDPRRHGFRKVREVCEPGHLPPGVLFRASSVDLNALNAWLQWRGIPHYRVDLDRLKQRLKIRNEQELLEEEYALSVSDHYWLCPQQETHTYAELNFFERAFDQDGFAQAMFRSTAYEPGESARHTPNNTLCGYHRKAWMKVDDKLCLYKGSTGFHQQECINEWLASMLGERLGLYCVPYDVMVYEGQLVSVCPNFLNPDLELAAAADAAASLGNRNDGTAESFLTAMEEHGITDARASFEELCLLDYLMMNTDRHGQNAGVLLDANTGQWVCMAPIFDTGTGLGCFVRTSELETYDRQKQYRLFSQKHLSFESTLERIQNWDRYDFTALDGVTDQCRAVLAQHRSLTGISDARMEALVHLLQRRIDRVKQYQLARK